MAVALCFGVGRGGFYGYHLFAAFTYSYLAFFPLVHWLLSSLFFQQSVASERVFSWLFLCLYDEMR